MIARVWHGWTKHDRADDYQLLLNETIAPGILARGIPGVRGLEVWRGAVDREGHVGFVTVMRFDDWSAVEDFAGESPARSVVPDEARRLLERFDHVSQHHDIVGYHEPRVPVGRPSRPAGPGR